MTMDMDRVPWLPPDRIERKAEHVLSESRRRLGVEIRPPVPIEAMIETLLAYGRYPLS